MEGAMLRERSSASSQHQSRWVQYSPTPSPSAELMITSIHPMVMPLPHTLPMQPLTPPP
jgi:hypothetical protein